ncbi:MAG: S-layer homology domain-containing protein [Clostridia bacterium]|nr:S-layer homology domain-containing protein [Clostridia bacterium]
MNTFKRRISLVLSVVMVALSILPLFIVNAATDEISYQVTLDSKTLTAGNTYTVEGGEKITFNASSSSVDVSLVGYYFNGQSVTQSNGSSITVTVPTGTPGSTRTLGFAASGLNKSNELVQGAWKYYTLKYKDESLDGSLIVKYNSKTLAVKSTTTVEPGSVFSISATTPSDVMSIYYAWDQEDLMMVPNASSYTLTMPSSFTAGSTHYLYVKTKTTDGTLADKFQAYKFNVQNNEPQVSMVVTIDGKTMVKGNTYIVTGGETVKAVAKSTVADIERIGYNYEENGVKTTIIDVYKDTLEITVPTGKAGSQKILRIEAVATNDDGSANTITKTGWFDYILKYEDEEPVVEEKDVNVSYNGNVLTPNKEVSANPGEQIKIAATPADKVLRLKFKWDNDEWQIINGASTYTPRIPTSFLPGSTHWLYVTAEYTDGTVASQKAYKFVIPATAGDITMNVKLDSKTITPGNTYEVEGGEEVVVSASSTNSDVDYITYRFGTGSTKKVNGKKATFEVPDEKAGTSLKLYVEAVATDGTTTGEKVYTLKFVDVVNGKLDIEPWMEENDEISSLAINLRNDSEEEDKANKNIYAIDEVVTYFVDYKNGTGKDIDSEVTIKLELPLDFEVVSSDGGKVNTSDKEITWTFANGLKEDEAGTKVVKVKYTKFSKSRYDSEVIYPLATISQGKKVKDESAVINLIIKDYDTEIKDEHEPYMYGDLNATTFRPDAGITRAEGALVLARIYGLDYLNTKVTDIFSDLDETYVEAQKAIVAATKAGLINGYTDGTYRPNNKMTTAEFLKILARMVEMNAEDNKVDGLEVKDAEDLVKVYADSTRYYIVDGKKVYSHWALPEITFLARLNMTPLSKDDDELDLDAYITRAEVAQLVNFYLLRAPANVTSKTDTGFSDVSRKHELVGDIIEATREAHTYKVSEDDGTEIAK